VHWHRVSLQSFIIKTYKTHFFHGRKNIYVLDHAFVSSFVWDSTHKTVKAENARLTTENGELKAELRLEKDAMLELMSRQTIMEEEFISAQRSALQKGRISRDEKELESPELEEELMWIYRNLAKELENKINVRKTRAKQRQQSKDSM
jgi:hypothetical protein